jgi:mevalonate kinase
MSSGQQPTSHLRSVASAPGKLILFGEHAVVHDRPAVAVATSLRTTADLEQIQELHIILSFPDLCPATFTVPLLALQSCFSLSVPSPAPCSPEFSQVLQSIFAVHASQQHAENAAFAAAVVPALFLLVSIVVAPCGSGCGLRLHVRSDLPVGAGLGSSAAFSVSVAAAALELSCMAAASPAAGPSACTRVERALVNDWALQATH